nr:unnamed protein product [Callosobruchus analis]
MAAAGSEGSPTTPQNSTNSSFNTEDNASRSPSISSAKEFMWTSLLVSKPTKKSSKKIKDGEWLCLKELQDVEFNMQDSMTKPLSTPSPDVSVHPFGRDPVVIERSNLVNISKLVVKELIEQSLRYGRMLDSDHMPLQHFFIVLEHVLRHGLRPKKGLLGPKKELWDILQMVEKYAPEAQDITASVRDLPTVRTHMGRARAWLRLALMQKKLADYLKVLIDHKDEALVEYFETDALMLSDEAIVIIGLLEEDLDCPQGVIDFSLYLRSSNTISSDSSNEEQGNPMTTVLDQKNYIEELNRHLNATVANLQSKVESLTTTNALMKEDLAISKNNLQSLGGGEDGATNIKDDGGTSGEIEEIRQRLEEERRLRREADNELEIQMCMKAEMEVAMKLLEKDIHEKQDTIVSLRRQLDDIKLINLEMYKKLQECEMELTQKGEMVSRLQAKAGQIGKILNNLEKYNHLLKDSGDKKGACRAPPDKKPRSMIGRSKTTEEGRAGSSNVGEVAREDQVVAPSDSTDSFVKLDLDLKDEGVEENKE